MPDVLAVDPGRFTVGPDALLDDLPLVIVVKMAGFVERSVGVDVQLLDDPPVEPVVLAPDDGIGRVQVWVEKTGLFAGQRVEVLRMQDVKSYYIVIQR